jgi:uncharacterized protein YndB with AHSA1/START domain
MERSIVLQAGIDEVWSALTRPERLSAWFGATAVEVELHPGGRVTFDREGTVWRGLVEVVEEPRRFAFRWLAAAGASSHRTHVEFRLVKTKGGTRLTVREGPLWDEQTGQSRDLAASGAVG